MNESSNSKKRILYITFDGILQPLGKSQILPYLKKLSENFSIDILSFERTNNLNQSKKLINKNIKHIKIKFTDNNLINLLLFVYTFFYLIIIIRRNKYFKIHCRSYIPALFSFFLNKLLKIKYIFDIRGFWADEKIEGGYWKKYSFKYLFFKFIENNLYQNSSSIITLTKNSIPIIKNKLGNKNNFIPINVIPTCVDMDHYYFVKKEINIKKIKFCYLGSIGGWYNFRKCLDFCENFNNHYKCELKIINHNQNNIITDLISKHKISFDYHIQSLDHYKISKELDSVDFGIFFIDPKPSKLASCPTKMGEFLSKGIYCITNNKIGDSNEILSKFNGGLVLDDLSDKEISKSSTNLKNLIKNKLINRLNVRKTAEEYLDINKSIIKLNKIYN